MSWSGGGAVLGDCPAGNVADTTHTIKFSVNNTTTMTNTPSRTDAGDVDDDDEEEVCGEEEVEEEAPRF